MKREYKKFAYWSSLGLMLPSSIVVGMVIGWLLDKAFKTWPWFFITFIILGIISGFYNLIKGIIKYKDE